MTLSFVWVSAGLAAPTTVPAWCDSLMISLHGIVIHVARNPGGLAASAGPPTAIVAFGPEGNL